MSPDVLPPACSCSRSWPSSPAAPTSARRRGRVALTDFQRTFHRAGHAHAGVLVTLSLVCLLFVDAAGLDGWQRVVARNGVPLAAILIPAGFFLSSLGRGVQRPNRLVALIWVGVVCLAAGVVALGVGLLS